MPKGKLQKLREIGRRGGQAAVEQAQTKAQHKRERVRQQIKNTDRKDVRQAIRKAGMTLDVHGSSRRQPRDKQPAERARETATMAPPTPARFNPTSNPEKLHMLAGGGGIGQPMQFGRDDGGDEPAVSPLGTGASDGPRMDEMVLGGRRDRDRDRDDQRDDENPLAMDGDLLGFGGER